MAVGKTGSAQSVVSSPATPRAPEVPCDAACRLHCARLRCGSVHNQSHCHMCTTDSYTPTAMTGETARLCPARTAIRGR